MTDITNCPTCGHEAVHNERLLSCHCPENFVKGSGYMEICPVHGSDTFQLIGCVPAERLAEAEEWLGLAMNNVTDARTAEANAKKQVAEADCGSSLDGDCTKHQGTCTKHILRAMLDGEGELRAEAEARFAALSELDASNTDALLVTEKQVEVLVEALQYVFDTKILLNDQPEKQRILEFKAQISMLLADSGLSETRKRITNG